MFWLSLVLDQDKLYACKILQSLTQSMGNTCTVDSWLSAGGDYPLCGSTTGFVLPEHFNFTVNLTPVLHHSLLGMYAVRKQRNTLFGLCSGRCGELLPVWKILACRWHTAPSIPEVSKKCFFSCRLEPLLSHHAAGFQAFHTATYCAFQFTLTMLFQRHHITFQVST
jgi:hypothetical protein